jgi:hypothetical protein
MEAHWREKGGESRAGRWAIFRSRQKHSNGRIGHLFDAKPDAKSIESISSTPEWKTQVLTLIGNLLQITAFRIHHPYLARAAAV